MKVSRGKASVSSDITIDKDLDMLSLYQIKNAATPTGNELLRKGEGDIANADIAYMAGIVVSKLVNTYFPETLMTAQGDILVRGASNPEKLAKIATGQFLRATATGYEGSLTGIPSVTRKTADQTVNNSATLVNDTHLLMSVGVTDIWHILLVLLFSRAGAQDWRIVFTVPSGGAVSGCHSADIGDMTGAVLHTDEVDYTSVVAMTCSSTNPGIGFIFLTYVGGGTAGTLQFQWAQWGAEVNDHKVLANSRMIAIKLN